MMMVEDTDGPTKWYSNLQEENKRLTEENEQLKIELAVYKPKPPIIKIYRPNAGGDVKIVVNDEFLLATLHYNYRYTTNAQQWSIARKIAMMVFGDDVEIQEVPRDDNT